MQRLLTVYFISLFAFAGLILWSELSYELEAESQEPEGLTQDHVRDPAPDHDQHRMAERRIEAAEDRSHDQSAATAESRTPDIEQPFLQLGYKTVYDALRDCELRYLQRINLPIYLPQVRFTHQLGKCHDRYTKDDYLEVVYLDEHRPNERLLMMIKPVRDKVEISEDRVTARMELQDGTPVLLSLTPGGGYHVLEFERNSMQYLMILSTSLLDRVPPEEMLRIAGSIPTGYPRLLDDRY
ncbi:hypothetical protein PRECH8_27950 [Insulibacter thermoxylanivorax]|uniref:Uncharacterized protein n=1 Tax=Insulibacter thermoxylanivorax TaxID=2749268 RepID=A0A916VH82_9BACL|nr:hypothetical protein [Insulibacter thermoxylanivorax]GFR39499.1 hypothetical protein PRECH8_27950 [Insulibacter thermoxylanivorax]